MVADVKKKKEAMTQEQLTNYAMTWRQAQVQAFDDAVKEKAEQAERKAKEPEAGPDTDRGSSRFEGYVWNCTLLSPLPLPHKSRIRSRTLREVLRPPKKAGRGGG